MKPIATLIILAGGDGTRFAPLTHKHLFSFTGKSFLALQLEQVLPFAEKIVVVTGKETAETVRKEAKAVSSTISVVLQEQDGRGQADAVLSCSAVQGPSLIMNSNDVFDYAILQELATKMAAEKKLILLAKRVTEYFPGGYLKLENGKVTGIVEKPEPANVPSDLTKLVVDYIPDLQTLIAHIKELPDADDAYEQALTKIIQQDGAAYIEYSGVWQTIKYPWQVLPVMQYFLQKLSGPAISKTATVSPTAQLIGTVVLGDRVKVGDYTKIIGPCYIGDDAVIGDFVMLRESNVGEGALIGGYCEVTRSYIGKGSMFHRNYVGDSVIGAHVLMGAEAVTANFRFDKKTVRAMVQGKRVDSQLPKLGAIIGDDAKIGVNCTILPGVKIGKHTAVGPQTLIDADLEDNIFYFKGEKTANTL